MPDHPKRVPEMIVEVLRSGKEMELSEIAATVTRMSDEEVKFANIANHMSRLFYKTEIGNFIIRKRPRDRYVYALAKGAQGLTPQLAYDLVCGIGKNEPALKKALRAKPSLKRYLREPEKMPNLVRRAKKAEKPVDQKLGFAATRSVDEKRNGSNHGLNINLYVTVRLQPSNRNNAQLRG